MRLALPWLASPTAMLLRCGCDPSARTTVFRPPTTRLPARRGQVLRSSRPLARSQQPSSRNRAHRTYDRAVAALRRSQHDHSGVRPGSGRRDVGGRLRPLVAAAKRPLGDRSRCTTPGRGGALAAINGTNTIIQASVRPVASGIWQPVKDLSDPGQDAVRAQIAVDTAGTSTAAWQRSNGADTVIQAARMQGAASGRAP